MESAALKKASVPVKNIISFDNPPGIQPWKNFPDGHIPVIPIDGTYYAWWSENESYRTKGDKPTLNTQSALDPKNTVVSKNNYPDIYSKGIWIIGVHRGESGSLWGFSHNEDDKTISPKIIKSMSVWKSDDNGASFTSPKRILTSQTQGRQARSKRSRVGRRMCSLRP
ncbi:hypothetical protein FACS1894204_01170 [Synergistales bacterium]|nr:hypothetical protein FACS1894204_01170 [Synergistales bacterium]